MLLISTESLIQLNLVVDYFLLTKTKLLYWIFIVFKSLAHSNNLTVATTIFENILKIYLTSLTLLLVSFICLFYVHLN